MLQGLEYIRPKLASGAAVAVDYRVAANGHIYLSSLDQTGFRTRSASDHAAQAAQLMRKYQELSPGIRARSDLARALGQAGMCAVTAGDLEQGLFQLEEEASTRKAILKESPTDVENRRELALAESFISGVEFAPHGIGLGREREARERMTEAVRLYRELVHEDPRNVSARNDLGLALPQFAALELRADPRRAESALREGIRIFESLPQALGGRDRHIGLLWSNLSSLLRQRNRLPEARAARAEAQEMYAHDNPADALARGDFLTLWSEEGQFALQTGDVRQAVAAYTRVWNALSPSLPAVREDIPAAFQMASCAASLAQAHARAGNSEAAAEWKTKSSGIWQAWKGRYPQVDRQLE
jgi:tetratricopeptide (TPR) repeat protein